MRKFIFIALAIGLLAGAGFVDNADYARVLKADKAYPVNETEAVSLRKANQTQIMSAYILLERRMTDNEVYQDLAAIASFETGNWLIRKTVEWQVKYIDGLISDTRRILDSAQKETNDGVIVDLSLMYIKFEQIKSAQQAIDGELRSAFAESR